MSKPKPPKLPTSTSEPNAPLVTTRVETNLVSALVAKIQYRMNRAAVDELNASERAKNDTLHVLAERNRAMLALQQSQELLNDADQVHETDQMLRDIDHLAASERLKQMKHQAMLAERERAAEVAFVEEQLQQEDTVSDMTAEEQELVDALTREMRPNRFRALLEKTIKDLKLSPDEEERAREEAEKLIRQSL